jgi:CHAT domain-containing protein
MATGFDASRATVMNEDLRRYQIVHFATHALINHEHPELSGIVLSLVNKQGDPENGFLQLHEIYNLRFSAELVTLSACSTGLGKEISGEGLVGLTRGFMYAGAKGVLASLWKVDDRATAELMRRYYRELLVERKSPAAALKAAKVELWRQKRWREPFYWASFVFQGDPAGVIILSPAPWYKRYWSPLLITLFLVTLLIGIYAIRWIKKRSDRRRKWRAQLP